MAANEKAWELVEDTFKIAIGLGWRSTKPGWAVVMIAKTIFVLVHFHLVSSRYLKAPPHKY
jgi:hypothetical protein